MRCGVSSFVSPLVSSCGAFCDAARSVPRLVLRLVSSSRSSSRLLVSSLRLVLYRAASSVSPYRLVGRGGLRVASLGRLAISFPLVRRSASSASSVSSGGAVLLLRPMSSDIPCRLVSLLTPFVRSSVRPFVRSSSWAWGVSGRLACGEIELTKTARFALYPFPPHPVREGGLICPCPWRGDGNRPRSNDSETRGRCRSVLTLGLPYMPAGRFR